MFFHSFLCISWNWYHPYYLWEMSVVEYIIGCVLFSVFKISISTFTHSCSLVRKAENCFWIKNNSKIEVAPKRQSFTITTLVWFLLTFILLASTLEVFVVGKWFIPFWKGNFTFVKLKCSTNMQMLYYRSYTDK